MSLRGRGARLAALLILGLFATGARGDAVSEAGRRLAAFLDGMNVERGWAPGDPVDWRTGRFDSSALPLTSHCSAFVAAVCERLGIYVLRPPEHSETLLANAQFDWLHAVGRRHGWRRVPDGLTAQLLANQGELVLACCRSPEDDDAGHIAIVRPSAKSHDRIAREGPDITQAGGHNYRKTTLDEGFRLHPRELERGEIRYFAHPVARLTPS
jgi:hypothetical protein